MSSWSFVWSALAGLLPPESLFERVPELLAASRENRNINPHSPMRLRFISLSASEIGTGPGSAHCDSRQAASRRVMAFTFQSFFPRTIPPLRGGFRPWPFQADTITLSFSMSKTRPTPPRTRVTSSSPNLHNSRVTVSSRS